jgi:hypothetical protein
MNKSRSAILMLLIVLVCLPAFGNLSNPNFAGVWLLDKEDSIGVSGPLAPISMSVSIRQDSRRIVVETTMVSTRPEEGINDPASDTKTVIYDLTGAVSKLEPAGATAIANWEEGGKLHIETKVPRKIQGADVIITYTDIWELTDDAKTLVNTRTTETAQRSKTTKYVFRRRK